MNPKQKKMSDILNEQIGSLAVEIEKILAEFKNVYDKEVSSLILAGGTAKLFGLKEFFEKSFKKPAIIASPFDDFNYPVVLENRLKAIGPSFAVALGAGLMGAES